MERYDARLCALWELPVISNAGYYEPIEYERIKSISENYRAKKESEWRGLDRAEWYAVLVDRCGHSETVAPLRYVEPADPEQFRRMKENYERRRSAAQDG